MWSSYLKTSLRTLWRDRWYTALNVLGLAVGIAACVLIFLYIRFETSFDEFHDYAERIVRVTSGNEARTPYALGPALSTEVSQVQSAVRVHGSADTPLSETRMRVDGEIYYESNVIHADSTFFEVFSFPLKHGDAREALRRPFTIVLTERLAEKYFGEANPLGKTIMMQAGGGERAFEITGVAEDPPANTHLPFRAIISFATREAIDAPRFPWSRHTELTYARLEEGAGPAAFTRELRDLMGRHLEEADPTRYHTQPLTAIHLDRDVTEGFEPPARSDYLYIFGTLALLLLVLAGVNYVNMATAQATRRAGEVGIRKVVGSSRRQLIVPFLGQSVIVGALAGTLAYGFALLGMPLLRQLTGIQSLAVVDPGGFPLIASVGGGILVGILAGLYPAFVLSRLQPTPMLRGRGGALGGRGRLRKVLVTFQFVISVGFIAATLIIRSQVGYMQSKDLGFREEQVIMLTTRGMPRSAFTGFKQEVENHSAIAAVTASVMDFPLRQAMEEPRPYRPEGMSEQEFEQRYEEGSLRILPFMVTPGITEALGLTITQGRSFRQSMSSADTLEILVNQTAVEQFGWKQPLGKEIYAYANSKLRVVGVMEDFHFLPLDRPIQPLVFIRSSLQYVPYVYVHFNGEDVSQVLSVLRSAWETFGGGVPLEYSFMDRRFDRVYAAQERLGDVTGALALVAILLAGMGLFGLASYSVNQRSKEISIRKVVGATTVRIAGLISGDFLKLVGIGFVLAVPLTALIMHRWLTNFAYRIDLRVWEFALAGSFVLLVSVIAVGYQSISAALTDPAESLRYE